MRLLTVCFVLIFVCTFHAQSVYDFKTKSSSNSAARTSMLNLFRLEIKKEVMQDVVFVVDHFLVSGNYAWLEARAQLKSGGNPNMPNDGFDCCHAEALFYKNSNGNWQIAASGAFSTDVWYYCISKEFPKANPMIFTEAAFNSSCKK